MNLNQPLQPGYYYHVYNRGINGENLFREERNYPYFLEKYSKYLIDVVDTFAYCLLQNHFHLLVRVKSGMVLSEFAEHNFSSAKNSSGLHSTDFIVSKQFARLFSSYTQSINKVYSRTGSLFDTPFKRIRVSNNTYLSRLIWYIHFNPQKHGFVQDFRDYAYSSYQNHILKRMTNLKSDEVISWFGNEEEYQNFHLAHHHENDLSRLIIEF